MFFIKKCSKNNYWELKFTIREIMYKPNIGRENLNEISNDNGVIIINFAILKDLIVSITDLPINKHGYRRIRE